jgi:hypothetical protein
MDTLEQSKAAGSFSRRRTGRTLQSKARQRLRVSHGRVGENMDKANCDVFVPKNAQYGLICDR